MSCHRLLRLVHRYPHGSGRHRHRHQDRSGPGADGPARRSPNRRGRLLADLFRAADQNGGCGAGAGSAPRRQ